MSTDASAARAAGFAVRLRRTILEQSKRANVGHIGSALSIADIIAVLFTGPLSGSTAARERDRSRFILSKGHAALALYSALHLLGVIARSEIDTFCSDGTLLGVHPDHRLKAIDFSTGSLGHGLSIGAGCALAARMQKSTRRTWVVLSDAECNEGSVWEAAQFASHHRLGSLCAIVDANGQQAFGYTKDVMNLEPLAERFRSFGWNAIEVDGHNAKALATAFSTFSDTPVAVVARTTFGKGVSFMQNEIRWHYSPMNDTEYAEALAQVGHEP